MIYVVSSTNNTGISMSAQGYLRPLRLANIDHEFVPYKTFLDNYNHFKTQKCLLIPVPSAWRFTPENNAPFINAFVCESNVIPATDASKLRCIQDIWTPSRFCQDVLKNNHFNSKWVPYSMEMPLRECTKNQKVFTFLCSFDGKFTIHRKGIVYAIQAFQKAFANIKDVAMVIKTFDLTEKNHRILAERIGNDDRITIINWFVKTVDEIYDDVDCYVSLHAAEGYGRHIAEAMLRKVPVICTNYGGNTDFCTEDTALLVNGEFVSHQYDPQYNWNGLWIQPNVLSAQLHMRRLFEGWVTRDLDKAKQHIETWYSDETVAKILKSIL